MQLLTVLLLSLCAVFCKSIDGKLSKRQSIETEPNRGPKSLNDRIAIVGAGPSGVHMAMLLKKKGFKNITVFEKENRVGGKAHTIYHRGTPNEMGALTTQPDYHEVFRLIEKYNAGKLSTNPPATAWVNEEIGWIPLTCGEYVGLEVIKIKPEMLFSIGQIQNYVIQISKKYINIHRQLFSDYEGEIMPRPSNFVLAKLNKTFIEFLIEHDIEALKALFFCTHTSQGYGNINTIPVLYGLLWMTPHFVETLVLSKSQHDKGTKILDKGFQFLWEEIVRQEQIFVKLNANVQQIVRLETNADNTKHFDKFHITYTEDGISKKTETFDFLIISPAMKDLFDIINFEEDEKHIFSKMNNGYFTTTLLDYDFPDVSRRGNFPQGAYVNNILDKIESSVWGYRDSYSCLEYRVYDNYTESSFPDGKDGQLFPSSVFYQFSRGKPSQQELDKKLQFHFNEVFQTNIKRKIKQITWPYFPKFNASDLASGILWDILDLQGKYKTWYIGSSVCFESMKSVVEYNLLLLRTINLPLL